MAPLSFAVVSSEAHTREALVHFCASLQETTGVPIEPVVLETYSDLLQEALAGRLQIIWAPPLVAIELEDSGLARPSVVVQRVSRSGYYAALFVRADSRFTRIEELRGARVAWVSKESASGYFVPRWHLRSTGIRVEEALTSERFFGSHEAATRAVLANEADVASTHVSLDPVTGKLASAPWLVMGVNPADVRVLLLVGPIPGDVVSISLRVDASIRRQLVAALIAMQVDGISRTLFDASRFEPVPEGHLDLLRRLSRFSETRG